MKISRKHLYQKADCVAVCVAADSMASLENVREWSNEVDQVIPEKPKALILTKFDLSYDAEVE